MYYCIQCVIIASEPAQALRESERSVEGGRAATVRERVGAAAMILNNSVIL
jgi:hypothetical protein